MVLTGPSAQQCFVIVSRSNAHCVPGQSPARKLRPYTTHLLNRAEDDREDLCLEPGRRGVGVIERGVRRAGMRGAVIGATGRNAMPLLASGMLPGPPIVGAAGMEPYGLVLMPAQPWIRLLSHCDEDCLNQHDLMLRLLQHAAHKA